MKINMGLRSDVVQLTLASNGHSQPIYVHLSAFLGVREAEFPAPPIKSVVLLAHGLGAILVAETVDEVLKIVRWYDRT